MDQFTPNCYVEVGTSGILAKIEALRMYRGVMRPYPHPRSEEYITGLAAFRGKRTGYGGLFTSDNPVYVYGDLMSLVCDANYEPLRSLTATNAFKESFKNRTNVDIDPEKELVLSAETVGTSGYLSMFEGCTSLTKAPVIVATTLGETSCEAMFKNCSSLVTPPPALLAEEVPSRGYRYMFENCSSLTAPPDMSKMKTVKSGNWDPGTNSDNSAKNTHGGCLNMFKGCTSLTSLPDLSGLRSVDGYGMYEMFFQCTGLTSVPAGLLSGVTQFLQGSFFGMFEECSNLVSVGDFLPKPASGAMAKECYRQLFRKCTKLSSVPSDFLPATTLDELCYTSMFEQCKALVTAPVLPAETMVSKCYERMFESCSSLTSIRCLATNSKSINATDKWLQKAKNTAECTFYKKRGANWNRNTNGIPDKWNVVEVD